MSAAKWHENRPLIGAFALAAAACLVYAMFSRHWLVSDRLDLLFGLRDNLTCGVPDMCAPTSNTDLIGLTHTSSVFPLFGWIAFVCCGLATLGLVGAGALALANKQPQLPISPSTIAIVAIVAGLIAGCVFVATKPGVAVGVGLSFTIFGAGAVGGIAVSQLLAKLNRAPDPDLTDGAMNPDDF